MTEFDSLRADIQAVADSLAGYSSAVGHAVGDCHMQINKLWDDIARQRDELYAVANRLEALTAFVTSNPAEVAAKIVNDANRATLREVRDDA